MKMTNNSTIPFMILSDARTVAIATAILQQAAVRAYGSARVSALKPAVTKSHLYGDIVIWTSKSPERTISLERFYSDEWLRMPSLPRKSSMPVRWPVSANHALTALSHRFPTKHQPRGNKSLAFCVIMAFAAKYRYGLTIPLCDRPHLPAQNARRE